MDGICHGPFYDSVVWDDVSAIVERLYLLFGEYNAEDMSVSKEIISISNILRKLWFNLSDDIDPDDNDQVEWSIVGNVTI